MVCLVILVPVFVLLPYFFHGFGHYLGSPHPDAWSYTVYGAYLWEHPRGTHGGLAPFTSGPAISARHDTSRALSLPGWRRQPVKATRRRQWGCFLR